MIPVFRLNGLVLNHIPYQVPGVNCIVEFKMLQDFVM